MDLNKGVYGSKNEWETQNTKGAKVPEGIAIDKDLDFATFYKDLDQEADSYLEKLKN